MSKIEVGKTYQTRDGKTVRILATDLKCIRPVVGALLFEDGSEIVLQFRTDGSCYSSDAEDKFDLIIPPERKSRWINWYCSDPHGYSTREAADHFAAETRTHVLEITTEDGEPVDVKIHEVER